MRTFLTINTTVPAAEHPGTPVIVFYSNGDWEVTFLGDTDYIESGNAFYVGFITAIDALTELRFEFDFDAVDTDGTVAHLYVEGTVNTDADDEPVLALYEDGEAELFVRADIAEMLAIEDSGVFNFIPFVDILEELSTFVSAKREEMFGDFDEVPIGYGDDEDGDGED